MSDILYMNQQHEDFLAEWYTADLYSVTYASLLQPVQGSTFWDHEGEGMVLPPDIVRTIKGRRVTARRRDANGGKGKLSTKYSRKGLPTHCSNYGLTDHDKRKCSALPKIQESQNRGTTVIDPSKPKRDRPFGNKSRIGNTSQDPPTASQIIASIRKHKERVKLPTDNVERPWIDTVAEIDVATGRGRGRGRGRGGAASIGRGRGSIPIGIGILHGDMGEVLYSGSLSSPPIVINEGQASQSQQQ